MKSHDSLKKQKEEAEKSKGRGRKVGQKQDEVEGMSERFEA